MCASDRTAQAAVNITAGSAAACIVTDDGKLHKEEVHPVVSLLVLTLRTGDADAVAEAVDALEHLSLAYLK